MINSNSNAMQGPNGVSGSAAQSSASISPVRSTFKGFVAGLNQRPLKPLAIQPFAGAASRGLELQVRSDTAVLN